MPTRHERLKLEAAREQTVRQRRLLIGAGAALAVALVVASIFFSGVLTPKSAGVDAAATGVAQAVCEPVQGFPAQGQTHIEPNQTHPPYNSNPPTSGWHWSQWKGPGIFTNPQVQDQLVHDLEHGFIVIQYNNLSAAEVQKLTEFVQRDRYHMILAPYPGLPANARITLTAWTKLQNCSGVDEAALRAFISAYRDQGPEKVP